MTSNKVLAIDCGTTGVTALVVSEDGRVLSRGYQEFAQYFPQPGWVEHEPEEIWVATLQACKLALRDQTVTAVGVTNQRETAVLWDRERLTAPRRAIVWQDRRTTQICDRLKDGGHEARVAELTGLRLDPYFTATKLAWLAEHDATTWAGVTAGSLVTGTVDSYVVARLTGELLDEVQDRLARLGYETLDAWAGVENYEERMVAGGIDPVVLAKLREATQ